MQKCPRIFGVPFIYHNLPPPYFRLQPEIKKTGSRLLLGLLKGFQNGICHNLIAQKLTMKIGSLEMDFCQTKDLVVGPLGSGHQPKNTTFVIYWLWKLGQDSNFLSKFIPFLPQTDRQLAAL